MRNTVELGKLVFNPKIECTTRANRRLAGLRKEEGNTIAKNNGDRWKTLGEYTTLTMDEYATCII